MKLENLHLRVDDEEQTGYKIKCRMSFHLVINFFLFVDIVLWKLLGWKSRARLFRDLFEYSYVAFVLIGDIW